MKKFSTLVLSVLLLVSLSACGKKEKELKEDKTLFLITDKGTIDDKSFNQGSYEGLTQYAEEKGITPNYLRPQGVSTEEYLASIEEAIRSGAKVIVTPGFLFEEAVYVAQEKYPEVKFVLVDGVPNKKDAKGNVIDSKVADNTVSILYKEEQSGFLAGYAAVKEGHEKLGFMGGMAVPAVVKFGYGYVAGANLAAEELNKTVDIRYTYLGEFSPEPKFKAQADSWYNDGFDVIFASAGGAGDSVMAAANDADKWMIGVDVDQGQAKGADRVQTSAMKNLKGSVYNAVKQAVEGGFEGGKTLHLGVQEQGVSLPDNFDRFETFKKADYDAIYKVLVDDKDGITTSIPTDTSHGVKASALKGLYKNVNLEVIGE